jgi:3-oxoacyl-[acyl-carrier protein] reductase
MNISLIGKRAIVGGASRGIGRAAARELALLGASVILIARNETSLKETLGSLDGSKNQRHHFIAADFSDPQNLKDKIESHIAEHGPVHILVNNTGGPPAGAAQDATLEQFKSAFAQHLLCNHILAQAVLPGMREGRYGRIINVISTSVKAPIKGLGVSNTIRAAVANWSKTLAGEVAMHGITVNNVLPGATDTDRLDEIFTGRAAKSGKSKDAVIAEEISHIPAGRIGKPEELAAAIAFLASPAASYINGINFPVDGGRTGSL